MNTFLAELRRRNVFRVAAAYLVVGWLVMQIVATIGSAAGLPDWADSFALILLITGFPIVLFIAWAFELTPEGMKKTPEADGEVAIRPLGGTDFVLIGLMVVVLGMIGFQIMRSGPAPVAQPIAQVPRGETTVSIAVLPFVDLSEAGDQEYFSDGISEEILNVLVRIPELGVAGRTSSFAFKNQNQDLRIIGEALGVNHVLEGSVRRSGERLRITAQLIRASDGFHIWSETYDRDLIDIFAIQDEIALAVSEQLAVSLGLNRDSLSRSTTTNIEAYEAYLRARPLFFARGVENLRAALVLLDHAVALDPNFAPAWVTMAGVYSVLEYYVEDASIEQVRRWRLAGIAVSRRAIELAPSAGEAHANLGVLLAYEHDWEAAFESLDRALELAPNDAAVLDAAAQRFVDAGYSDLAIEYAQRAVAIEPLLVYQNTLGWAYSINPATQAGVALEQFRAGIETRPDGRYIHLNGLWELIADGRRDEADALLEQGRIGGAWRDDEYEDYRRLLDAWGEGERAVRSLIPQLATYPALTAGIILDDMDIVMENFETYSMRELRNDLAIPIIYRSDYQSDPRWKAQIERDGLLDLWRARGFPPGCQAVGDADFSCDWRPAQ
jgi:TolB-like protein